MADLDPVVQQFEADLAEYDAAVREGAATAQEFAAANEEAKAAVDGLRDSSAGAAADTQAFAAAAGEARDAAGGLRDSAAEAALSEDELRNKLSEAAAAAGIYRDETGKLRDAQDRLTAESALQDLALGHTRDKALEAAAAFRALRDEERAASDAGLLSRIRGSLGGLFGSGGLLGSGGAASGIPVTGGLTSVAGIGAIAVAVEALLPLVAGVASGFAAAATGAGAFFLLAHPALSNLKQDYQALNSAQQKYQQAQAVEAADPTKAHLKAVHDALVNLQVARQGMTQDEGNAAAGVARLSQEYHKLTAAFAPEAYKVFGGFLTLANQLLPDIAPFAKTFADALSGLLGKASGFAGSQGFKDWLAQFRSLEGPAITAIGDGIGKVAISVGKLLTAMSAKDVVNAINIAFTVLNGTIQLVTYMLKRLMDNWDGMSVAAKHSWYDIKQWTDDVTHVFDTLRHATAEFGHDWASAFDTVRHTTASWGHDTASVFDTVRHAAAAFGHDWASTFDAVRHATATAGHDIASAFDTVRHAAATLGHDTASTFDTIRHTIASWADSVKAQADRVISWFTQLPGRIVHALGDMGHLLVSAGEAVINGLISGIESAFGSLGSALGGVASFIVSHKGPIEVDRLLLVPHGRAMMAGLIDGIQSHLPALRGALAQVSGTVASASIGGAVSAGGGTSVHVQVPVQVQGMTGDLYSSPQFGQYMQHAVQEAVLRYGQVNVSNGLTPAWGQ